MAPCCFFFPPIKLLWHPQKKFYRELKKILGFFPRKIDYYQTAFIHRSASRQDKKQPVNNERLEYLGDAVLGAVVGEFLFKKYPEAQEGFLTQTRSKLVNGNSLNSLAENLGITHYITAQVSYSKNSRNLHGDALEALIGAIYLDRGYNFTRQFIIRRLLNNFDIFKLGQAITNFKSRLIEWGQKNKLRIEFHTVTDESNGRRFLSSVMVDQKLYGSGRGISKKEAEQNAARETLLMVDETFFLEYRE